MLRVGITGQAGFMGGCLWRHLQLHKDRLIPVAFRDEFFEDRAALDRFVRNCDVVVHLAAVNRHPDPEALYRVNLDLVDRLTGACERAGVAPHIVFASSTQESNDSAYGRSKREGRARLEQWAERHDAPFTGLIIPNVFGPFGKPFHNSVVATFCHQLIWGEEPRVEQDKALNLIHVDDLARRMMARIMTPEPSRTTVEIAHTDTRSVSEILRLLVRFRDRYLNYGIMPSLADPFERNLFNTFLCALPHDERFPHPLDLRGDERGEFAEVLRADGGGQVSFSTTRGHASRGHHFHTRKVERFVVVKGRARIGLRRVDSDRAVYYEIDGQAPAYVDIPVWHTHSIDNLSSDELYMLFWISEPFDKQDPDTFGERVEPV